MQSGLRKDYGLDLDCHKVWKGNELVMHDIHVTNEECYDRLRCHCDIVRTTNLDNVAKCEIDPLRKKYRRLFNFHACAIVLLEIVGN